jgi:hypothetical protein
MEKIFLILIIIFSLIIVESASAHQPRIVSGEEIIQIENPEVSQAFYGELNGEPAYFEINSIEPFRFYIGILVPDLEGVKKDISARVYLEEVNDEKELLFLDGSNYNWEPYYEEFAGDSYYKGPEISKDFGKGKYIIEVFNSNNQGKYVLVIGEREEFPPKEIIKTIILLPSLKKDFFNKSPFTAYFNLTGLFLLIFLLVISGIVILISSLVL